MLGKEFSRTAQTADRSLGLPPGFKGLSPFPFGGINQQDSRFGIQDNEFYWIENYIKLGNGRLRSLYDVGPPIYAAPVGKSIIKHFWYNIGEVSYVFVFLSDGTAVQVTAGPPYPVISIAPQSFPFYDSGGGLPVAGQWGSQYLIIANNNTSAAGNSYWVWDGTLLYGAGTIAPPITVTDTGIGYTGPPTVTVHGGHSTVSPTFAPVVNAGGIVEIDISSPGAGFQPGDIVQMAFSGGGSDSSAVLRAQVGVGSVQYVDVTSGGANYSAVPSVTISAPSSGRTATATASLGVGVTAGQVVSVTITDGGSGYTTGSPPTVSFGVVTGSTPATATTVVNAGSLDSIIVTNSGFGYTSPPVVTIAPPTSGTTATAHAVLFASSSPRAGQVSQIIIDNAGTGYTDSPNVSFSSGTASALALLVPGSVTNIVVDSGGTGYFSVPTLTLMGGGGINATAAAVTSLGAVTNGEVTTGGRGYNRAPAVVVQSGVNNSAAATIALMPYGISGNSLETFQSRVWIARPFQPGNLPTGGVFNVSAPESISDFATSAGGLSFTSSDRFLRAHYTNLRQSNGYLYPVGDSSVSVISNVQTTGSPSVTTFNYQNTDPQTGSGWIDTFQDFSRTVLFANPFGVYGLYGGAVTKISSKVDILFDEASFPPIGSNPSLTGPLTPSSAVINIHAQKCYLILLTINERQASASRNVMLMWNEREWYVVSQSKPLTFIASQETGSTLNAWGTDGNTIFQLLTNQSSTLTKTFSTKLYGVQNAFMTKQALIFYLQSVQLIDSDPNFQSPPFSVTIDTEFGSFPTPMAPQAPLSYPLNPPIHATPYSALLASLSGDIIGQEIGFTVTTTQPNFELAQAILGTKDISAIFGDGD